MKGNTAYPMTEGNLAYKMEPREEIIGGRVVLMAPVTVNHSRICRNLSRIFDTYLHGRPCEFFPDTAGLYLEEGREVYEPDGMVVCDPEKVKAKGIFGAPDLVIEILSPGTAKYDRGHKRDTYERHGVREYWIISPLELSVEQYLLLDGHFVLWDIYRKYTPSELADMTERERAELVTEFKCSLFEDLTIRLDDLFGRVVIG